MKTQEAIKFTQIKSLQLQLSYDEAQSIAFSSENSLRSLMLKVSKTLKFTLYPCTYENEKCWLCLIEEKSIGEEEKQNHLNQISKIKQKLTSLYEVMIKVSSQLNEQNWEIESANYRTFIASVTHLISQLKSELSEWEEETSHIEKRPKKEAKQAKTDHMRYMLNCVVDEDNQFYGIEGKYEESVYNNCKIPKLNSLNFMKAYSNLSTNKRANHTVEINLRELMKSKQIGKYPNLENPNLAKLRFEISSTNNTENIDETNFNFKFLPSIQLTPDERWGLLEESKDRYTEQNQNIRVVEKEYSRLDQFVQKHNLMLPLNPKSKFSELEFLTV